jgi:hypothetical protein
MDERARSVVRESSGRCAAGACGRTTVWQVVVGRTRLWRDGVGSRAVCHELVRDSSIKHTLSGFQERVPCMGRMIIEKRHHVFIIMDAIDGICLQVRVYDLKGAQHACIIWRK